MPQALSAVYVHLVFSTKDRPPWLRDRPTREALHAFLGSASKQLDCPPLLVGGVEDHVRLLTRFGRTITQADWVKELKRVSNICSLNRSAYAVLSFGSRVAAFGNLLFSRLVLNEFRIDVPHQKSHRNV